MKKESIAAVVIPLFFLSGCSPLEAVRKGWGSSTQALEEARGGAISNVYNCQFEQCFDTVLELARDPSLKPGVSLDPNAASNTVVETRSTIDPQEGKFFDVFINDPIKGHIVIMGIVGNVDTTEVGIFFTPVSEQVIKIEVASLSTTAKEKVAKAVFEHLNLHFTEVK